MANRKRKTKRLKNPRARVAPDAPRAEAENAASSSAAQSSIALRWWGMAIALAIFVGSVGYTVISDSTPSDPDASNLAQRSSEIAASETKIASPPVNSEAENPATANVEGVADSAPLAALTLASVTAERLATDKQLDPDRDGWESEAIAEQAKKTLLHLAQRLAGDDLANVLKTEVSAGVTAGRLRPAELTEIYSEGLRDKRTVVRRAVPAGEQPTTTYQYRDGLSQALDDLALPLANASDVHVHVKVIRISITPTTAETVSYLEVGGRTSTGSLQQRATWHCGWNRSTQGKLQLNSIRASDYEEVSVAGPWLVDCTDSVLSNNRSFREQLSIGHHHWLSRLSRSHGIHVFSRSGMSVGDVNGDGLDDVYVCQPGGLPNRLFLHQADGTAIDNSQSSGVDWLDQSSSALILDLDNDGDQDLVVATSAGLLVMENNGRGKFQLRTTLVTQENDTQSFSAVDYDHDGDLDLYICIEFADQNPIEGAEFVYHDSNDGAANVLFRNDITAGNNVDSSWKFVDVTKQVGLDADNRRHSLACAWEDFDNDGDQDLYVANDYGQNCLYENQSGQFKNIASQANATDSASGMSVSWGDYNHDGWMDLYVANMFSSAGNRITRQAQFKPGVDAEIRDLYSRFAKGNTLLENDGHGQFREVSKSAGVEMGRWAWSSVFTDLNNDSWDDLLVANGYITTSDTGDL